MGKRKHSGCYDRGESRYLLPSTAGHQKRFVSEFWGQNWPLRIYNFWWRQILPCNNQPIPDLVQFRSRGWVEGTSGLKTYALNNLTLKTLPSRPERKNPPPTIFYTFYLLPALYPSYLWWLLFTVNLNAFGFPQKMDFWLFPESQLAERGPLWMWMVPPHGVGSSNE